MDTIRIFFRALRRDERGATAIEYGLIAALIVLAMMGGLRALGGGSDGMWTKVADEASNIL